MSKAKYMRTMKPHDINQRRANAPRRAHAAVTADCATRGTATCPNRPEGRECKHVCGQERHYKTRAAVKETWMDEACGAPRQPNRPAAPLTSAVRPSASSSSFFSRFPEGSGNYHRGSNTSTQCEDSESRQARSRAVQDPESSVISWQVSKIPGQPIGHG